MSQSETLRKRVEEFYSLLQRGRLTQAESYITKDTLEIFRHMTNNPFLGFEVGSVEMAAGGKNATVLVQILFQPQVGPPVKYPRNTNWRLERGKWLLVVPEPVQLQMPAPAAAQQSGQPKPEELQFQEKQINFGVLREGDKPQGRFSFKNVTNHPVTIARVDTDCPCLRLVSEKKTYAPGEAGELILEFDTQGYLRDYEQTVVVRTDPGELRLHLLVKAHVQPRRRSAPQTHDTPPASGR